MCTMAYDISKFFEKTTGTCGNDDDAPPLSLSTMTAEHTQATDQLMLRAKHLSSSDATDLIKWLRSPNMTGYQRIAPIINGIKGGVKLVTSIVPLYPFEVSQLVSMFKHTAQNNEAWSSDQLKTVRRILRFLRGDDVGTALPIFRVNGYPGTGKTTVMIKLMMFLIKHHLVTRVALIAPTHAALEILEAPFSMRSTLWMKKITVFASVHKQLGFKLTFNDNGERVFVQENNSLFPNFDFTMLDESSMVASELSELIINSKSKIIVSGDSAQLPPVNEASSTLCVDPRITLESTLRETLRNRNQDMITLFMAIRRWIEDDIAPDWRSLRSPNIIFYRSDNDAGKLKTRWMKTYLADTTNNSTILTWTRKWRDAYNAHVRNERFATITKRKLQRFEVGEKLIISDFYKHDTTDTGNAHTDSVVLHTSEQLLVVTACEVMLEIPQYSPTFPTDPQFGMAIRVEHEFTKTCAAIQRLITHQLRAWRLQVVKINDPAISNTAIRKSNAPCIIHVLHESSIDARNSQVRQANRHIINLKNSIAKWNATAMSAIMRQVIRPMFVALANSLENLFAEVNYDYARTCHSGQGRSLGNCFVDLNDILSNRNIIEGRKCLYVAITRSRGMVHLLL